MRLKKILQLRVLQIIVGLERHVKDVSNWMSLCQLLKFYLKYHQNYTTTYQIIHQLPNTHT